MQVLGTMFVIFLYSLLRGLNTSTHMHSLSDLYISGIVLYDLGDTEEIEDLLYFLVMMEFVSQERVRNFYFKAQQAQSPEWGICEKVGQKYQPHSQNNML